MSLVFLVRWAYREELESPLERGKRVPQFPLQRFGLVVLLLFYHFSEKECALKSAALYSKASRELDVIPSASVFSSYWDIFALVYEKDESFHIATGSRGY